MQPNGSEKNAMRRLYEFASTLSVVSILLSACGFEVPPPKATTTPVYPTESPTPTPIPERFKKEGIGILVEAGYVEAGRDFSVLSKYLDSMGFTMATTQEQWSGQSVQFQGKTVHAVEAVAKTGEHLFIMTLADAEKTEMITTVKGVVVDKDTNQTHEKMWTQQDFPMDEFLHLWGNVPKETQKKILEEVFGKATPGVPEEFQALQFASGHFMLLAYPNGNGGVVRDEDNRIVGFEGGSVSFVGKDASGNPLFKAGQRKLIWMPFIRGNEPNGPKLMNALFSTEKQPEISDKVLAEQLSTAFGVKITGFERSDAGFFAMNDKERVLVFDGSWQFASLHAWFTRDRIALKAGESTIPLLNNQTRRYDQIVDAKTGEVFAKWNVEKGKWEGDAVEVILNKFPEKIIQYLKSIEGEKDYKNIKLIIERGLEKESTDLKDKGKLVLRMISSTGQDIVFSYKVLYSLELVKDGHSEAYLLVGDVSAPKLVLIGIDGSYIQYIATQNVGNRINPNNSLVKSWVGTNLGIVLSTEELTNMKLYTDRLVSLGYASRALADAIFSFSTEMRRKRDDGTILSNIIGTGNNQVFDVGNKFGNTIFVPFRLANVSYY